MKLGSGQRRPVLPLFLVPAGGPFVISAAPNERNSTHSPEAPAAIVRSIAPARGQSCGLHACRRRYGTFVRILPGRHSRRVHAGPGGDAGHDHDHNDHHGADGDDHHCPVGHLLLSAAAIDDTFQSIVVPAALAPATTSTYSYTSVTRSNYHSRRPPA